MTVPPFDPDDVDIARLDADFRTALTGTAATIDVVGFGEISTVFAWPARQPRVAVKSLPTFDSATRLAAYADLLEEYLDVLRTRGVQAVPTALRSLPVGRGAHRAYALQPLLASTTLGPGVLAAGGSGAERFLGDVVAAVMRTVDDRVGLDAQVSNWAVVPGSSGASPMWFVDVTTPMLRDRSGRDRLDTGLFVQAVPWMLRGAVHRFVAPDLLAPYYDPRRVFLDTAGNLIRERLPEWIPRLLEVANDHLSDPLTVQEVHRFYRGNARTWSALQAARRADRTWQQRVRRRPYDFLLPDHYDR